MIIKNSNLRRFLFSNRYKVLAIIVAIILILYLVPTVNNIMKENIKKESEGKTTDVAKNKTTQDQSKALISGGNITSDTQELNKKIIDTFINACNNGQIQVAYDLLSDECKEELYYKDMEYFKKTYVEQIFKTKKIYRLQAWINSNEDTYQIKLTNDILASGIIDENEIEEYYTIVKSNEKYRLNINSYIRREEKNKKALKDNISIEVLRKNVYREYEIYDIKIENKNETDIILDSKETTNSVYILGENEAKYSAFMHEVDNSKLLIEGKKSKTISIKFNKRYSTNTRSNYIVFEDIIINGNKTEIAIEL